MYMCTLNPAITFKRIYTHIDLCIYYWCSQLRWSWRLFFSVNFVLSFLFSACILYIRTYSK